MMRNVTGVRRFAIEALRVEQFAGCLPWRSFRSRHGQSHRSGSYWSATMGGHVVHESQLELARMLLADFDPDVVGIYAQPLRLVATVDGRPRAHVPDFLLVSRSGLARICNVKPAHRLTQPKVAEALGWPAKVFADHGWLCEVWTGADRVLLDNVRFLAAYRRPGVVADEAMADAWRMVRDGDCIEVAERRLADGAPGFTARPALLALLWRGRLRTDLTRPLSGGSVLRRSA